MLPGQPGHGHEAQSRWQPAHVLRLALLAPVLFWTVRLGTGLASWCFLDHVNLAFHEAGHLFLAFAGEIVHTLGGTLGQLAVPVSLMVMFVFRERQLFPAALCFWWAGENLINIAVYMSDARHLALPLVGGGEHDWNTLLYRFGLLSDRAVETLSTATHWLGFSIMLIGLAWSAYFALPGALQGRVRTWLTSRWPWVEVVLEV